MILLWRRCRVHRLFILRKRVIDMFKGTGKPLPLLDVLLLFHDMSFKLREPPDQWVDPCH